MRHEHQIIAKSENAKKVTIFGWRIIEKIVLRP